MLPLEQELQEPRQGEAAHHSFMAAVQVSWDVGYSLELTLHWSPGCNLARQNTELLPQTITVDIKDDLLRCTVLAHIYGVTSEMLGVNPRDRTGNQNNVSEAGEG